MTIGRSLKYLRDISGNISEAIKPSVTDLPNTKKN